jgi:hypothetical protein
MPAISISRSVVWDRERFHVNTLGLMIRLHLTSIISQSNPNPCCRRALVSAKPCLRHGNCNVRELPGRRLLPNPPSTPYSLGRIWVGGANNSARGILLSAGVLLHITHTAPIKRPYIPHRRRGFRRLQRLELYPCWDFVVLVGYSIKPELIYFNIFEF